MKNKVLLLGLIFTFVLSGCVPPADVGEENENVSVGETSQEQELVERGEKNVEEEKVFEEKDLKSAKDVESIDVIASSVLIDNTSIGFNYEATMVLDRDFSTAWCSNDGKGEIVLDFGEVVEGDKFGFVAGFGRDEKIYFENNRVKKLAMSFSQGEDFEDVEMVELKDVYGMQFVDLRGKSFKKIKLKVEDVYKGAKYKDTCIAEVDFSSDYVVKEDAGAAMKYYVDNKKALALVPYDIVGFVGAIDFGEDSPKICRGGLYVPAKSDYSVWNDGEHYAGGWDGIVHAFAEVNQYGKVGDKLLVRWYFSSKYYDDELDDFVKGSKEEIFREEVEVFQSCNGGLWAHSTINGEKSPTWNEKFSSYGNAEVVFSRDRKVVGSRKFGFAQ